MILLGNDWDKALSPYLSQKKINALFQKVEQEYQQETIFPPRNQLFRALELTPFQNVHIVILGQDPYHRPGLANGLAFSVAPGCPIPPSLRNIFRELSADCGIAPPLSGDLSPWAERGALLLNTILTVREGKPNSHRNIGWETFTDAILDALNARNEPTVFLLWGASAQQKRERLTNPHHFILTAAHPSPLAAGRGFFGCRHFSAASEFLAQQGISFDWNL